jgi:hypothetical protein
MNENNYIPIRDNHLISYEVFCERREIHLHTEFRDCDEPFQQIKVIFTGVEAYDFWHDSKIGTVIFHISEVSPSDILADHEEKFHDGIRHGWPGEWAHCPMVAEAHCQEHGIRGFEILSSSGMSGWVLAKSMQKHSISQQTAEVSLFGAMLRQQWAQ